MAVHVATIIKKFLFFIFIISLSYSVLSQQIQELSTQGFSEDMGKNEEIIFFLVESSCIRIGNPRSDCIEKHKFKSIEITTNFVNISIDGNKLNTLSIPQAQTRKADIDKDNVFDLSLTVDRLRGQVASVTFKSLEAGVTKFESTTTSTLTTTTPGQENSTIETNAETENETLENVGEQQTETIEEVEEEPKDILGKLSTDYLIYIIFAIIAIVLISLLLAILLFRRKKPEVKHIW